jgi:hypothetical protein
MVSAAAEIKQHNEQRPVNEDGLPADAPLAPVNAAALIQAAEKPKELPPEIKKKLSERPRVNPLAVVLGGKMRFLVGGALLVLCFLWMNQNNLIPDSEINFEGYRFLVENAKPLSFLPAPVDGILSGFNVGAAGLLLVISALARRWGLLFFMFLGVAVLLGGPQFIPDVMGYKGVYIALLAGLALAEFGIVFNRAAKQAARAKEAKFA